MLRHLSLKTFKALRALVTHKIRVTFDGTPFEFHRVSTRRIFNWILTEASTITKPEKPWGWPTHLMIEPTARCNLRCTICPVTTGMNRPTGDMDFNIFKKAVDEVGDYSLFIMLWGWGEPFLSPSIYDMISYAKKKNIKVVSSTNGHLFARGDHPHVLVRSGIDALIFALDGICQKTYERYRKGGDLNTVIAGIRNVVAAKKVLNSRTPVIDLRFIAMKHNEHEIPKLKDFARSLGVDLLTLKTLNPYHHLSTAGDGNQLLPEDPRYQRFKQEPETRLPIHSKNNPCGALWNNPFITWDGKVCPCCFDLHNQYVLGDLTKDTFKNIWYGPGYQDLRRMFRTTYQEIDLCSQCTYAFRGGAFKNSIIETHFIRH